LSSRGPEDRRAVKEINATWPACSAHTERLALRDKDVAIGGADGTPFLRL
jgi:hypothetical protein